MTKKERNQLIWERYQEGYSQEEIGKFYNLSQSAVSLIIVKKERNIPEPTQETRGAKSKLTSAQLSELRRVLSTDPVSIIGFSHWNNKSIQALIEKKFGVHYHKNYIWKLMKKIGFSSQLPQQKDYRQNQDQVQDFKLNRIPAIKKSDS